MKTLLHQSAIELTLDKLAGIEAIDKFVAKEFSQVNTLNDDEAALWSALLVCLSYMQRNGHSCVSLCDIANTRYFEDKSVAQGANGEQASQIEETSAKEGIMFPPLTSLIRIVKGALEDQRAAQLFVYEHGRLYSRRYYDFEQEIAQSVVERTLFEPLDDSAAVNLKSIWTSMFPTETTQQQDWQQVAVAKCLVQRFGVINGGPGTGKTYTVLRLLLALQAIDSELNIVLAAPTGKAQQRMTESILNSIEGLRGAIDDDTLARVPTDAITIHRLLGLREHTVQTQYHRHRLLNIDVLIVDEASMVDLALMARIMRALPAHAKLYFIGDADQLPAVELGNVLEQLVEQTAPVDGSHIGAVPSVMRQHIATLCPHLPLLPVDESAKSWVATLQAPQRFKGQVAEVATAIQQGDANAALFAIGDAPSNGSTSMSKGSDFLKEGVQLLAASSFSKRELSDFARQSFSSLFNAESARGAMSALNGIRWLTPIRKGEMGVEGLNELVYNALKDKIKRREGRFYQGQPIMILKNHHPQRLSNGEVGVIWPDNNGKLQAWFEASTGELRSISLSRLPQHETVFAMTIHKSQGSEFAHVVMLLPPPESDNAANLFHRGLVYTGLTRAKTGCLMISNEDTFSHMVKNRDRRYSGLASAIYERAEKVENGEFGN